MPCINLYPTTICDAKNDKGKLNTIASYATKSLELSIKDFYCVFVRTEMNLNAFSGPRNCVNTQYAALSGAMNVTICSVFVLYEIKMENPPPPPPKKKRKEKTC